MLSGYSRTLDGALRWRKSVLLVALLTFVATGFLFKDIPKGFFPEEDIGQMNVSTEAAEDVSFLEMVRLQDRVAALLRADPAVASVTSFNGGQGSQNVGRMFINLKPRSERPPMKQVIEGLRKKLRSVPASTPSSGRHKTCSSAAGPARPSTSTSCRAFRPVS